MSALHDQLTGYLAVRRALGYRLEREEKLLSQFLAYLDEHGIEQITVAAALAWATLPSRTDSYHAHRLGTVRGFAQHLHAMELPVEVPPSDLLPNKPRRAVPYIYTDAEIAALFAAAGTLHPAHRVATARTLIGLLAVTGMRRGEALALDCDDFDPATGVLIVRAGKFGKSRELPLHPTTVTAVTEYLQRHDRPLPADPTEDALLLSEKGDGSRRTPRTTRSEHSR